MLLVIEKTLLLLVILGMVTLELVKYFSIGFVIVLLTHLIGWV